MDYKKIIRSQKTRFKLLHFLSFLPDEIMINIQYRMKLGRKPNLKRPRRFTEKLQWYKLHYHDSKMTQCSDKYAVREYVMSKGLGHILNNLYAVYDRVEDISLDVLPDKFVMKTTNGSGTNYLCKSKSNLPIEEVRISLREWLNRDIYSSGREWAYKDIKPNIIVEELLETDNSAFEGINDYKILCFDGEAKYIVVDVDRQIDHKRNIYDTEWNLIEVSTDHPNVQKEMSKPDGLKEMLEIANTLAEDFPFVRVDLYWVNQKIYFGELTFYPWTGYVQFKPDEFDIALGDLFRLDKMMFQRRGELCYCDPLMMQCADKYRVREYVKSKEIENILVPLYAVNDSVDEIKFGDFPDKFVLKTNNGSHTIILYESKSELDVESTRKKLNQWINA